MMKRQWIKRQRREGFLLQGHLFPLILFLAVISIFIGGLRQASVSQSAESLRVAKESVMRAVISCYALEGSYPDSFEYLKKNYNVKIDETKYIVHYDIFASNIMPEISIVTR